MKRSRSPSLEELDQSKAPDELPSIICGNRTHKYHVYKKSLGDRFLPRLQSVLSTEGQSNPFLQAFRSFGAACSRGIERSYYFRIIDNRTTNVAIDPIALVPFVFTLVIERNNSYRVLVNRVVDIIEHRGTRDLLYEYDIPITLDEPYIQNVEGVSLLQQTISGYPQSFISCARLMDELAREHAFPTDHFLYADILTILSEATPGRDVALLEQISFDDIGSALSVGRCDFMESTLNRMVSIARPMSALIKHDNFNLLRQVIVSDIYNAFCKPLETKEKLCFLFSKIAKEPCMLGDNKIDLVHMLLKIAIRNGNAVATETLLEIIPEDQDQSRKKLFEKENYQLFTRAFQAKDAQLMIKISSLLSFERQRIILMLAFTWAYIEIKNIIYCYGFTREMMLKWILTVPKRTDNSEILEKSRLFEKVLKDRQAQYDDHNFLSYKFTDLEVEFWHYFIVKSQESGHDHRMPHYRLLSPIEPGEAQDEIKYFLGHSCHISLTAEILGMFENNVNELFENIYAKFHSTFSPATELQGLFRQLSELRELPHSQVSMFQFMPFPDLFFEKFIRERLDIVNKGPSSEAVTAYFDTRNYSSPLWTHQLDVVHSSKHASKSVGIMGSLWHAAVLKNIQPLFEVKRVNDISTNFIIAQLAFTVTNINGNRSKIVFPIFIPGITSKACPSEKEINLVYQKYLKHALKITSLKHEDNPNNTTVNLLHSEKSLLVYLDQVEIIKNIAEYLAKMLLPESNKSTVSSSEKATITPKVHSIVFDLISANQSCKSCQLMLLGFQNSHGLENGFLANLALMFSKLGIRTPKTSVPMVTRISAFQPLKPSSNQITGESPDIPGSSYGGIRNILLFSTARMDSPLANPFDRENKGDQIFAIQQGQSKNDTVKNVKDEDASIRSTYKSSICLYGGVHPLNIKQMIVKNNQFCNRVILCSPQKSTDIFLSFIQLPVINLNRFTLFCSGSKSSKYDKPWSEAQKKSDLLGEGSPMQKIN